MEPSFRGMIEKDIDNLLAEELDDLKEVYAKHIQENFIVKSVEDVLFGWMLGMVHSDVDNWFLAKFHRNPTAEEIKEFWEIIVRRGPEIQTKVKLTLST